MFADANYKLVGGYAILALCMNTLVSPIISFVSKSLYIGN